MEAAGIIWLGPTAKTLHDFALKHVAREIAEKAGVSTALVQDASVAAITGQLQTQCYSSGAAHVSWCIRSATVCNSNVHSTNVTCNTHMIPSICRLHNMTLVPCTSQAVLKQSLMYVACLQVPVLSGSGLVSTAEDAVAAADTIGYPVLLKATGGGGGRGIFLCYSRDEVMSQFHVSQKQGEQFFGNSGVSFLGRTVLVATPVVTGVQCMCSSCALPHNSQQP